MLIYANRVVYWLIAGGCMIVMSRCGKCKEKNMEYQDFHPNMERYFGGLRAGAWWVMEKSGGALDSIYVENYSEGLLPYLETCTKEPFRTFGFSSRSGLISRTCKYTASKQVSDFDVQGHFHVSQNRSTGWETNEHVELLDLVVLNGSSFQDVIELKSFDPLDSLRSISFAPDIGPIQWVTVTDTLNVVDHGIN